jgi:hypothetical protein
MENYREFNSFYDMKEWLKQGEFILPAVYKTLNDGKYYFDDVLFSKESNASLYDVVSNNINGITFNSNGEVSKVLSEYMDSNFVQKETFIDKNNNEHHLNTKLFPIESDAISFKEFHHFKHYGSVVKKKHADTQIYKNMIFPRQFENSNITEIIIPEGIEYIAPYAFQKCKSLVRVILPSTLKGIGRGAFRGCELLEEIFIPSKCEVIETSAFKSCTSLRKLTLSKGVNFIGERAFFNTGIVSLFIPPTVTYVGSKSFAYCSDLKKVYIGSNLHTIKNGWPSDYDKTYLNGMAFYKSPVEYFNVDKSNEYVKVGVNGELMIKRPKGWMIIKVPYNFNGMYVADPTACSMIRNVYEVGKERNSGESLSGINFSNITIIPKNLCSGNNNIERLVMPHIHQINYHAFTGDSIKDVQIGTEEYDFSLSNGKIKIIENEKKVRNTFRLSPDCNISVLQGNIDDYRNDKYFMPYLGTYSVDLNTQWGEDVSLNPDDVLYDGVYYSTTSYNVDEGMAFMYIDIDGYDYFHCYIRSHGETNYDFVVISNLDEDLSTYFYGDLSDNNNSLLKASTKGNQQSDSALTKYTHVEYDNIGGGSHRICVGYIKDGSVNNGNDAGYVLIPTSQVKKIKVKKSALNKYVAVSLDGFNEEYSYIEGDINAEYKCYESTNSAAGSDDDSEYSYTYRKMRVYFSGSTMFTCYVGSSSESNYDFICVSHIDTEMNDTIDEFINAESIEVVRDADWLFTSAEEYNDIAYDNLNTYKKIEIECPDKNEHFIEIYYVKDSSAYNGSDKGYVVIPSK